jgi:hypothetical protein
MFRRLSEVALSDRKARLASRSLRSKRRRDLMQPDHPPTFARAVVVALTLSAGIVRAIIFFANILLS